MMKRPSSSSVPNQHFNHPFPPLPFTGANGVGAPPPPPHHPPIPPYYQIPSTMQPTHSRPIFQPSSYDSMPVSVEERFTPSLPPPSPFSMNHSTPRMVSGENLLPPRNSHWRSNSDDVAFGFSSMMPLERSISRGRTPESESMDDVFRAYMNLDHNIDVLNSFGKTVVEEEGMGSSKTNGGRSSDSEGESNVQMRAGGDVAPPTGRHNRSVSMDSCFLGKVGKRGFSADEMEKIAADEKLAEIVRVDPKRVKRILANRASAARAKERKTRYIAELEHKVQILQGETTTLSAQLTHVHRDSIGLQNLNSELKFRVQAMEQQAQIRYALSEQLTEELQRLRLVIGEPSRSESNISKTSLNPEMFQQQLRISQLQQQHSNQNCTMNADHASDE